MPTRIIVVIACLLSATSTRGSDPRSVEALLDIVANPQPIPYQERQAAKQELIARPYSQVLPKLAPRIANAPTEWSARIAYSGTGRGLGDEHAPPGEQAIWALNQIWSAQTYGEKPAAFASDLVTYLDDPAFAGLRARVIQNIRVYWCEQSEPAVATVFRNVREPTRLRYLAAEALRHHQREKYLAEFLDFIEANPTRESAYFVRDLLLGCARHADDPIDARLLIVANSEMEREIRETGRTSAGYHTALAMGVFIASRAGGPPYTWELRNPFAVPKYSKYKDSNGNPNEAFSEAHVAQARAWWTRNEQPLRTAATRPAATRPAAQ